MKDVDFKLIIFTSFLGAVREGVRAIAYECSSDLITIYGYLDRNPEDEDYEVMDGAVTEIMASYPKLTQQNIVLEKTDDPIGKLHPYSGWVFVRHED
ncbi:hypothetical protein [Paraburkholderia sp. RL17-337-BIB-A]|uniref:hypothetical protein n=1 Tax=Paraburkholderia sp. RL17-337-BIB-A TaxID=3031636 RepID=UPI0038BB1CAD